MPGPVAQRQSSALIRRWLLVRIQPGPLLDKDELREPVFEKETGSSIAIAEMEA
jgi:hypothetical protein